MARRKGRHSGNVASYSLLKLLESTPYRILAGPHTRVRLIGAKEDPRDVKRITGASLKSTFRRRALAATYLRGLHAKDSVVTSCAC
eukprot:1112614-Prymnesium_polylepis.1